MTLPNGWVDAMVVDVVGINPANPEVLPSDETPVSFVPMAQVEELSGHLDSSTVRLWREVKKGYSRFQEGDVVVAKITPSMENGKAAIARGLSKGIGAGTTEFHVLRPRGGIEAHYVLHYILQESFRRSARSRMTGTAGQLRVPAAFLEEQQIPLAPQAEQVRIVETIKSYLSRLDAAVARLERAQTKLKAYRASVLKAAVEGRLVPTEAELARREGRSYEPADVLLARILKERRRRWEDAELARMKAAGKSPTNDRWMAKYEQPMPPDTRELPSLPEGWCWATVDQLSRAVFYGSSSKTEQSVDEAPRVVPVLRMGNIVDGVLDLSKLKFLPVEHEEFPELLLESGDLLFNRTNSPELVGKTAIYKGSPSPCSFASYLICVRFLSGVEPQWIAYVINSPFGRQWIWSVVTQQVGQANVNGSKLKALAVPLPPAEEHRRCVSTMDLLFSNADVQQDVVGRQLLRLARLRQAILKWAFQGRLVDQDPADEPADVLLARIRAERAAVASDPAKKSRARGLQAAS